MNDYNEIFIFAALLFFGVEGILSPLRSLAFLNGAIILIENESAKISNPINNAKLSYLFFTKTEILDSFQYLYMKAVITISGISNGQSNCAISFINLNTNVNGGEVPYINELVGENDGISDVYERRT